MIAFWINLSKSVEDGLAEWLNELMVVQYAIKEDLDMERRDQP